jgi:hypothetical protein
MSERPGATVDELFTSRRRFANLTGPMEKVSDKLDGEYAR